MTRQVKSGGRARSWLAPIVIAVCAAGAGITGTLLWMQNRAPVPPPAFVPVTDDNATVGAAPDAGVAPGDAASTNSAPSGAPSANAPVDNASSTPPPNITAGLAPGPAALALGNWNFDHEQWQAAIENYNKAIGLGIDNPDVRTDLGSSYRFAGQPQPALAQYQKAQQQNAQHENSLFNQGGVYAFNLNDPAKAIGVWQEYLRRFPKGRNVAQARQLIAQAQTHLMHSEGTPKAKMGSKS